MQKLRVLYLLNVMVVGSCGAMEQQVVPSLSVNMEIDVPNSNVLLQELFATIKDNKPQILGEMIQKHPDLIDGYCNVPDFNERVTALHFAAAYGRSACVERLLTKANANVLTNEKNTPLHYAQNPKVASLLLAHNAIVDRKNKEGHTPLWCSLFCTRHKNIANKYSEPYEVARVLVKARADIDTCDKERNCLLHKAVFTDKDKTLDFLLRSGANPYQQHAKGLTAFEQAVMEYGIFGEKKDILAIFEKYGMLFFHNQNPALLFNVPTNVSAFVRDPNNCTILRHWARLFTAAKFSGKNGDSRSPFAKSGVMSNAYGCIVKNVVEDDLKFFFTEQTFKAINESLVAGCKHALQLVECNSEQKLQDYIAQFPFSITYDPNIADRIVIAAVNKQNSNCLKIVLENKINCLEPIKNWSRVMCNCRGNFLHYAVICDNPEAIKLLAKYGVDCLHKDICGKTPIEYALELKRTQCADVLNMLLCEQFIKALNIRDYKKSKKFLAQIYNCNVKLAKLGNTLLHEIVYTLSHHATKLKTFIALLRAKGADINMHNDQGITPLWYISDVSDKYTHVFEILLKAGADVNLRDKYVHSLLHTALWRENFALAELCLDHGAVVDEKDLITKPRELREKLQKAYSEQHSLLFTKDAK